MSDLLSKIGDAIIAIADALCEYPEFILLIGGGLFLFISQEPSPLDDCHKPLACCERNKLATVASKQDKSAHSRH